MQSRTSGFVMVSFACVVALMLVTVASCGTTATRNADTRPAGEPGVGQQQFDSDALAAAALVAAAKARDRVALDHIFGPSVTEFISGDKVEDEKAFDRFVKNASEHLELEKKDAKTSFIDIGKDNWPFPIPLTRLPNGKWFFDTEAGKQEILARRIGANELETIKVCRAYVEAQREYASADRDGSGVLKYAQHFMSHNGKDGLYWVAAPGEEESPFGPLVAQATLEGYTPWNENIRSPALLRLRLSNPDVPRSRRARRKIRLRHQRQHDRRICPGRLPHRVRHLRRDDLHHQPPGEALSKGSGTENLGHRPEYEGIRSRSAVGRWSLTSPAGGRNG